MPAHQPSVSGLTVGERPDAVLELRDVVREYPGTPPIRALDGVNLRVDAGELVAIVGPSGSGKSTLLNVMGTLDRPTSGSVSLDGQDMAQMSDRRLATVRAARLGFVFQAFHLLETVSALDNVATGLLYRGASTSHRREQAAAALARVGLADRLDARPAKLSGGQRQRVAIARAIVADPSLVLADEPTGNLDTATGDEIMELLRGLHRDGSTILVITHDDEVADACPRRVRMRDGAIESDEAGVPTGDVS